MELKKKLRNLTFSGGGLKILILELLKMHFIIFRANHRKDMDMITSKQIKDKWWNTSKTNLNSQEVGYGRRIKWDKYKTHSRILEVNSNIIVITINTIGLKSSVKRQKLITWIKKYNLAYAIYMRCFLNIRI